MGMLIVARMQGEGVYIGHHIRAKVLEVGPGEKAHVLIEAAHPLHVSWNRFVKYAQHHAAQLDRESRPGASVTESQTLAVTEGAFIGHDVKICVLGVQADGVVKLGIAAPRYVSISRDDYTRDRHLKFQSEREARP